MPNGTTIVAHVTVTEASKIVAKKLKGSAFEATADHIKTIYYRNAAARRD